jgi:zinc protease
VALFKEILAHPTFSDSVIAREKQEMEMGIDAIQQSPSALANQLFYEVLFENHPYASPTGGTRESLKRIHFNQLRDFHATHYVARNGALTIVGNLTQPEAEKLAAHIATALPEGAPADPLPDMPKSRGTRVVYQPYPSSQCHIRIGTIAIQANDPHQDALLAANHLLGGDTLNSRLGGVIREERGLSYSISSWFVPMQSPGPFAISTEVQPQRLIEAITAIQHTLDEWRNTPVSPDELEQIQKTLAGRYPLQLTSNQSLLGQLANFAFYDMDPEKLNTYIERIQRLTPEALYQAVHSFWETSQWVIVIVGGTAT